MSTQTQTKPTENYVTEGCRFAGANWLKNHKIKGEPLQLSPFGEKVADILGEVFRGIYHLCEDGITKCDWKDDRFIKVRIYGGRGPATFDNNQLTQLVILCHDRCVRLEIRPCNMQYLYLMFSRRERKENQSCFFYRHPTLEEQIEELRIPLGENE